MEGKKQKSSVETLADLILLCIVLGGGILGGLFIFGFLSGMSA